MKSLRVPVATTVLFSWLPFSQILDSGRLFERLKSLDSVKVRVGGADCREGTDFNASIAADEAARSHGLSERVVPLAANEAMLFVFDRPSLDTFWMKKTFVPLHIDFFDSRGRNVQSWEMAVESDPDHPNFLYASSQPYRLALESAPGEITGGNHFVCAELPS